MSFCIRVVLISEPVHPSCAEILLANGIEAVTKTGLTKEELIEEIKNYDGLVVRSATKVTADIIRAADNLKVIGRAGTGVDNIDCDAATRRGILVVNAPGGNALSAAELTCGMIVSLSRNIPQACASLKSGKWDRKNFMGNELNGKTLGIVGLGRIGREVATRMQSFGMTTVGFDPLVLAEASKEFGVESLNLEDMWPICDYITVHTPLIPQTKNLINEEVLLSKCKKGVRIVNCARGGIVDEDALLKALDAGHCGGAGLDVYLEEPPKNTALLQHPKVICTPHLGASTHEAQVRVAEEIAQQFVDLIKGKFILGIVNSPTFCSSLSDDNRPWVALCTSLGKVMGALFPQGTKISGGLTVYGSKLKEKQRMMAVSSLVGLLQKPEKKGLNLINAPILAKDAGIEVTTVFDDGDPPKEVRPFLNSVALTATGAGDSHSIITTMQESSALLCAMDGCAFQPPVPLAGKLIFCHGKRVDKVAVNAITELSLRGNVSSAFMSTPFDGGMWCVIKAEADVPALPSNLAEIVDFWAELNF